MSLKPPSRNEFERASTPKQRIHSPRYDRNNSGDVEYTYVIDVSDFRPEEIQITQSGNCVSVNASTSKIIQSSESNSSSSRSEKKEYHKSITLPPNSDLTKKLKTNYENGKLILRMPVTTSTYTSLYSPSSSLSRLSTTTPRGQSLHSEFFPEDSKNRHTEKLFLGPGFSQDNVKINASGDVITVTATQDQTDAHGCHSTRQYSSEHKFPNNVDLERIQADWNNGELIISAPYKI